MKKMFYLGFCLVMALGVGCAITNYDLITDNDQVKSQSGKKTKSNGQNGTIKTKGRAHIRESSQAATTYPDGSDELIWFVTQRSNGDRKLYTYNNFSTGSDPIFHSDLFCNTDHSGCVIWTADDPQTGDADIFDGTFNTNCLGARSLSVLLGTTRYYGECGAISSDNSLSVRDRLTIFGNFEVTGTDRFFRNITGKELSAVVSNQYNENPLALRIPGNGATWLEKDGVGGRGGMDLTNPTNSRTFNDLKRYVDANGKIFNLSMTLDGVTINRGLKITRMTNRWQ